MPTPALKNLRKEYSRSIEPARALAVEALQLENEISCLVNQAYGLTREERRQAAGLALPLLGTMLLDGHRLDIDYKARTVELA